MSDVLGVLPTITIALVRNSDQAFALRWTPSDGRTLDMSGTTITLEIDSKPPMVLTAETGEDPDNEGSWLTLWTIDTQQAQWNFHIVRGQIVSVTGNERQVVMKAIVEVLR